MRKRKKVPCMTKKERAAALVIAKEHLMAAIKARQTNSCKFCGAPTKGVACSASPCQKKRQREFDAARRETGCESDQSMTVRRREEAAIREMRLDLGLPQLDSGNRKCRHCGKTFYSWDRLRNQHCGSCQSTMDRLADGLHGFHRGIGGGASRRVPR